MCYYNKRSVAKDSREGEETVTQLVGVLCEDRTKVVLVSDRMVSQADMSLAFEHEAKYEVITPTTIVLRAGTVHEPEIIAQTQVEMKGRGRVQEIAERLSENYRQVRRKRVEHEILQEMGIISFDDFYDKQRVLHDTIITDLWMRMRNYDLGIDFLLGGIDEKAHLYRITEPGTYRSYDEVSFCCIGSGDRHAEPVFAFYGFSPKLSEHEALQIAFEAKKRAEMAGGVGYITDAWIIETGGIYEVSTDTISELEGYHKEQESASRFLKSIEIKKKKLKL